MPALSIFTPVYNAEKFLNQCLDSIIGQTFSDFELVLYDDGSRDSSYKICEEYAARDSRIMLFKGENGSAIDMMNQFIQKANGKYIGFVDDDDFLARDYFYDMIHLLEEKEAECVVSSYTLIDSENNILPWYTPSLEEGTVLCGDEAIKRFLTSLDIEGFRWNKIYQKKIFVDNGIQFEKRFPTDILGEFKLLSCIKKAVLSNNRGYFYRQSSTSEVASKTASKQEAFLNAYKLVGEQAIEDGLWKEGDFYKTWRVVNSLFNAYKSKREYSIEEWETIKRNCSLDKWISKSAYEIFRVVSLYPNKRDSRFKFMIKTVIVCFVFRKRRTL